MKTKSILTVYPLEMPESLRKSLEAHRLINRIALKFFALSAEDQVAFHRIYDLYCVSETMEDKDRKYCEQLCSLVGC